MPRLFALLPLAGFFLALTAFWCWSRAREAAVDADLQRRLGEHAQAQEGTQHAQTPLAVSAWLSQQKTRFRWLAALLAVAALVCFGLTFRMVGQLH